MTLSIKDRLLMPFKEDEIEWRISRVVHSKVGPKAVVLAYVDSRAIMNRLDEVFGWERWQDSYQIIRVPDGKGGETTGVVCTLTASIRDEDGDWIEVSKSDGAGETAVEPFKGGISDSLKRAAVHFGIGRYLYGLDESWVTVSDDKRNHPNARYVNSKDRNGKLVTGYWTPPALPEWALPDEEKGKKRDPNAYESQPLRVQPKEAKHASRDWSEMFTKLKLPYHKKGFKMDVVRTAIKKVGAMFNGEDKYWYIPTEKAFNELKAGLDAEHFEMLSGYSELLVQIPKDTKEVSTVEPTQGSIEDWIPDSPAPVEDDDIPF